MLTRFRSTAQWLLPVVLATVLLLTLRWIHAEWRHRGNPAKWYYVASTAVLFVVILVSPFAGIMGYVGAHAVEYFIIVGRSIGPRYSTEAVAASPSPLGRVIASSYGRLKFFAAYAIGTALFVFALSRTSSLTAHAALVFTVGGLHVFYDGFLWKLRRPIVANSLGISRSS